MKKSQHIKTSGFLLYIIGILMFFNVGSFSQTLNLVPNPSFEDTIPCSSTIPSVAMWGVAYGSPDYFNEIMGTCSFANNGFNNVFGHQPALTGNAYMGFGFCKASVCGTYDKEAIQSQLSDTLTSNSKYCVSFYVNRANNVKYSSDDIGFYLSPDSSIPFPAPAQYYNSLGNLISDTINWTNIKNIYTAIGNERFINIGNFKTDANTTMVLDNSSGSYAVIYYYIDDVSIYELPEIDAGIYDSVYIGNSVQLNGNCTGCWAGLEYRWFPSTGLSDTTIINPLAQPTQTTTYYFGLTDPSGTISCMVDYVDSVTVYVTGVGIDEYEKKHYPKLYPNPNAGEFILEHPEGNVSLKINILDLQGRNIYEEVTNKKKINLKTGLENGVYLIHITNSITNEMFVKKLVVQK